MSVYDKNSNSDEKEIDMAMLTQKAGDMYRGVNSFFYRAIRFMIRNIRILAILLIIGGVLGFVLDRTQRSYEHQVIVIPNFGSVDYLYNKVSLLNSKIKEKDTTFLKSIGITKFKKISKITVSPVVDIYRFIHNNEQNIEMVKLMAEDSDIKKIVVDPTTSKYYRMHQITVKSGNKRTPDDLISPILEYLNDSDYYRQIQKEYTNNVNVRIKQTDTIVAQINSLLKTFSTTGDRSASGVYITENTQLNEVIETKERLIRDQGDLRIDIVSLDKIVKISSTTINLEQDDIVYSNMKIILPLLFVFIYLLICLFRRFYTSHSLRDQRLNAA